jgi:predicted PurR-regulated permease PerM
VLKFGLGWELLGVWATFAVVQGLEGFVITPRIMGEKVGLHPLVVMLALLVGGNLFGVWGMLLAIPVTAAAEVLVGEWVQRYRGSRFFADEDVQDAS